MEFTRYSISNPTFSFVPDPLNQPESGYSQLVSGISEVDIIDKDFTYPQVLRSNIAIDQELPWGIIGTMEFLYSRNINDILYQNLNLRQTGKLGYAGRILYARDYDVYTTGKKSFNDVIYLTNSGKGYSYSLSLQFQKNFNKDSWANLSYTYGQAKDVNSGNSSQAASNFNYNPVRYDANDPELTWSMYDVRHRIGAAVSYTFHFLKTAPTTIGLFYGGSSGLPFSTTYYTGDPNGDSNSGNDLCYIPKEYGDVIFTDTNGKVLADQMTPWLLFDAFISKDAGLNAARGTIVPRNASRLPWYHGVDARLAQDIPIPGLRDNRLQITFDIVNLLNLINKDWGKSYYVSNQNDASWTFKGYDAATGKEKIFYTDRSTNWVLSNLGSRWGAQLGLRYLFH
jgi:hypothetical protein